MVILRLDVPVQVEVRSMGNPPAVVKLALESICLLLGENATDWKAIRQVGVLLATIKLVIDGSSYTRKAGYVLITRALLNLSLRP